ncbi:MAG: hypothetical protein ACREKH_15925 [Candidatus Rokuibacteriota bacterium]
MSVKLGRPRDWLSKVLRGRRTFRVADLYTVLNTIGVAPSEFFGELYDLYRLDQIGAEIVPGFFEGPVRRFVEQVARRTAAEVAEGRGRLGAGARRRSPPGKRAATTNGEHDAE